MGPTSQGRVKIVSQYCPKDAMSLALSQSACGDSHSKLIHPNRSWEFLAVLVWVPPEVES